ncbi:hypothetical protein NKI71_32335, partial [Mesorhizobium sp. M0510]|uniref:hypothetical protein n=1 Tax=Mesorhizobium sp. M0510 TaxID=2956954 RepID=UPI0033351921
MWHGVEIALELDMIVGRYTSQPPLGELVFLGRQRGERWSFHRLEQVATALAQLAHDVGVDPLDSLPDSGIGFVQGKKRVVTQPARECSSARNGRRFRPWLYPSAASVAPAERRR